MPPRIHTVDIGFPHRGIDRGTDPSHLPIDMSRECVNVRPFTADKQYGGGKRSCLRTWPDGSFPALLTNAGVPGRILHLAGIQVPATIGATSGTIPLAILNGRSYRKSLGSAWSDNGINAHFTPGPLAAGVPEQTGWLGQNVYLRNGNQSAIFNLGTGATTSWAASVTAGTLPEAFLTTPFRRRMFVARLAADGSFCACSRAGNPLDWDYNADPLPTSAWVASAGSAVGQPGDVVNALVPFYDDYLIFGCQESLWRLTGDPQAGGQIILMSSGLGMVHGRAWTFDETGALWFLSPSGLYYLPRGGIEPVDRGGRRITKLVDTVNFERSASGTLAQLAYDSFRKAVHIMLTPRNGTGVGRHVVMDIPTGFIGEDEFELANQPWSVLSTRGDRDIDRGVIMGSTNGRVLRFDDAARQDDSPTGTTIEARWRSAPISLGGGNIESLALDLQIHPAAGTGPWEWYWLTADSADELHRIDYQDAAVSGVAFASGDTREMPISLRARGAWHQLLIRQKPGLPGSIDMRCSKFTARLQPVGRVRV